MEPARAREILEPRLQALGFTPFLSRERGHAWIQALPLGETAERSRPALTLALFLLTLLSTLAAGSMVAGSFPWITFDPAAEPGRLLDGLPFAFTLLAILGTHEFGHYFTARAYGASVSLPYLHPGAAAALHLRHAGRGDPDALAHAGPEFAPRHRRRGPARGAAGGAARAVAGPRVVPGGPRFPRAAS